MDLFEPASRSPRSAQMDILRKSQRIEPCTNIFCQRKLMCRKQNPPRRDAVKYWNRIIKVSSSKKYVSVRIITQRSEASIEATTKGLAGITQELSEQFFLLSR